MSNYLELNDEELIHLIREGNEGAMDSLIQRYISLAEIIASKYPNAPIERDDLIQEGMFGFLNGVYNYDFTLSASPKTYIEICIERKIINAIRKCSRKKDFPPENIVPFEEEYVDLAFPNNDTPESSLIAKEQVNDLTTLIEENLSTLEVTVFRLHMTGYSYSQIAKKLKRSPKSIDNTLQRIRNKLNKLVL